MYEDTLLDGAKSISHSRLHLYHASMLHQGIASFRKVDRVIADVHSMGIPFQLFVAFAACMGHGHR